MNLELLEGPMDVLGLDAAAVGRLHDAGVVAGPDAAPMLRRAARGSQ